MAADTSTNSSHYTEYVRLLKELHLLALRGHRDTSHTDALRDDMDAHWEQLDPHEIERVKMLSADLGMLRGTEVYRQVPDIEKSPEWLAPRLDTAWHSQDWTTVLALLRTGPTFISPIQTACLRARAYQELGHADIALLFYEHAAELAARAADYLGSAVTDRNAAQLSASHLPDTLVSSVS